MTLKQLHQRLGEIIAEHDARGWSDRNDQRVVVKIAGQTPKGRIRNRYFVLNYARTGSVGFGGAPELFSEVEANEKDEVGQKVLRGSKAA